VAVEARGAFIDAARAGADATGHVGRAVRALARLPAEAALGFVVRLTEEVVNRLDLDALVGRLDVQALLDRVDVQGVIDRVDVQGVVDRVDVNRLLERVDVDGLVARTEIGELIARSTTDVAGRAVDSIRSQGVGLDRVLDRVAGRLRPGGRARPAGPPRLVPPDPA
jgi:hypothetical protein